MAHSSAINPESTEADWLKDYHQFQRSSASEQLPETLRRFIDDDRNWPCLGNHRRVVVYRDR